MDRKLRGRNFGLVRNSEELDVLRCLTIVLLTSTGSVCNGGKCENV